MMIHATEDQINAAIQAGEARVGATQNLPLSVWLLTAHWGWDEEDGQHYYQRQSIHTAKKNAILRLMDIVYEITNCTPEEAESLGTNTREDGAEFGDLDAADEFISYSVIPLTIEN